MVYYVIINLKHNYNITHRCMSYYGSKIWNLLYAGIMLKKIQMYLGNE